MGASHRRAFQTGSPFNPDAAWASLSVAGESGSTRLRGPLSPISGFYVTDNCLAACFDIDLADFTV